MITTKRYIRKPVHVDAVRVSHANFEELAEWCHGEIRFDPDGKGNRKRYIFVRVHNPKNDRQKTAFVGDWLLYTDHGYKVYTNKSFVHAFELAEGFADMVAEARKTLEDAEKETLAEEQVRAMAGLPADEAVPSEGRTLTDAAQEADPENGVHPITSVEQGAEVSSDGWQSGDVREDVIEMQTDPVGSVEQSMPEVNHGAYAEKMEDTIVNGMADDAEDLGHKAIPEGTMEAAKSLIKSEGGTMEEATPEAIAEVVAEQERTRTAAEAAGKRVLSEKEQREMDPEEIKGLLQSGDVILAQDLVA